jgi:hypothetical protein
VHLAKVRRRGVPKPAAAGSVELAEQTFGPGRGTGARTGLLNGRRDDRVLRATRVLSVFIAPFLALGFGILYLFPDHTRELFASTIRPRMTAMMLGAAYLGGIYFFVRAAASKRWHEVEAGFIPVTGFAALLGIATILHWNKFNHDHAAFVTWAALYFTTPFLVVAAWLRNRRTEASPAHLTDTTVPGPVRLLLAALGALVLAVGLLLFLAPGVAIGAWPWALTPLTARVVGSLFFLGGLAQLSVARDRRWSAARITLESQLLSLAGIELAAALSWEGFIPANPLRWLFVAGLLAQLAGLALLWVAMQARGASASGRRG